MDKRILWMLMMCIFIGLYSIVKEFQNIFTVDSLKLPIYQYALVYLIHFIIIFFHELGHGFACKYFGGKVGKIGVAFIIFNPAMYCDISDIRMFKNKYKQMLCSAAGFIVNAFFIGVFSICLYFNNINFFRIMIGLNATSILINAIPFVRLDGYWILSFGIGISNLYHKSIKKIKHIGKRISECKGLFYFRIWNFELRYYMLLLYPICNRTVANYIEDFFSIILRRWKKYVSSTKYL